MKKMMRQELPWLLAFVVWFLIIPLFYFNAEAALEISYLMLLIGNPLFCMIINVLYGMKYGRKWGFLCYPIVVWIASMVVYYNSSAMLFGVIAILCAAVGLIFGGWLFHRRQSEAEKWETVQVSPTPAEKSVSSQAAPRIASKTAAKNQQKAAARKAKERAEKEQKLQNKNAPQKKKKKGGH